MALAFCGPRLRDQRRLAGITAAQLAARVGRSTSSVLAYEVGAVQPPLTVAAGLADALSVHLDLLLVDVDEPNRVAA
ncbi:helix-turn-helix domain-containing protein [Streptomyces sp. HUAS ZL42]|uniref:helix-turn-helix domain-containing protein n=1 Tax=Streptomyces sp. HUAS ZL42 TaxID=3231715 RepID=UPI00345E54A9